jgi:hypothetical protein
MPPTKLSLLKLQDTLPKGCNPKVSRMLNPLATIPPLLVANKQKRSVQIMA